MKACHADILPVATLRAMREAAAASGAGDARTWLPTTPLWRRAIEFTWRQILDAGGVRCCLASRHPPATRAS
jgi:hypothetical protein